MVFSLAVLSWLLGPCWCGTPFFFLSASFSSLQVRRQRRWKRQSHICILYPLFYIFRVCAHLRSGEGQTFDWYFKGIVQNMGKRALSICHSLKFWLPLQRNQCCKAALINFGFVAALLILADFLNNFPIVWRWTCCCCCCFKTRLKISFLCF